TRLMIGFESITTALIGAALGITVGVFLGYLVSTVLSGQGLVFAVPWSSIGLFVVVAIFVGIVAAILPAQRAARLNVLEALLHDAGFTPRLLAPEEQFEALRYGVGLTNAAFRTTPGSGDLRRRDFAGSAERLFRLARDLRPRAIAFVGKEAYRGVFGERAELGLQPRIYVDTGMFVLPSTSPANAAVPYAERLRWFEALRDWVDAEPVARPAVRALVLDSEGRALLLRW